MSRRFGRNQKRRMRAEVVAAQVSATEAESRASDALGRARRADRDQQEYRDLLADLIGILDVEEPSLLAFSGAPIRRVEYNAFANSIGVRAGDRCREVRLAKFSAAVHRNALALSSAVHFEVSTSRGDFVSSYRLSEDTLWRVGLCRSAAEQLAQGVARRIVEHCMEQAHGGRRRSGR